MNKVIGVILIVIGLVLIVWTGFNYPQKDKTTKTVPTLEDTTGKIINWPLYIGAFSLAGGFTIIVMSKKEDKIW